MKIFIVVSKRTRKIIDVFGQLTEAYRCAEDNYGEVIEKILKHAYERDKKENDTVTGGNFALYT